MTNELRRFIQLVFELILLGAIVTIAVTSAAVGKASLNNYVNIQDTRDVLPQAVEHLKGSVGYYELIDLIDSYASTTDVVVKYKDTMGNYSTMTFTTAIDGKTVKLAVGNTIPKKGVAFTGLVYSRQGGVLYRNGLSTTTTVMETDMKLSYNALKGLDGLAGNGVLEYNFLECLFDWAKDARFVCTVTQSYGTDTIESIVLQMRD